MKKQTNILKKIEKKYDETGSISDDRILVLKDGKCGFVDLNGDIVVPLIYDMSDDYSENKTWVTIDNKTGFIDVNGNIIIPIIFDYASAFYEGKADVTIDHHDFIINEYGLPLVKNKLVILFNRVFNK